MIEVRALTKRYGAQTAIDGLTFTAPAGKVTGFLGVVVAVVVLIVLLHLTGVVGPGTG